MDEETVLNIRNGLRHGREDSDYERLSFFDKADAEKAITEAERFISFIRDVLIKSGIPPEL
ncbi:MAG: hypothetical protein HYT87_13680 [Nitrospirae bacterium]|nr:hypothetical protein [Nitrospirota bacterium]